MVDRTAAIKGTRLRSLTTRASCEPEGLRRLRPPHVVLVFNNFGPYHMARLSAPAGHMRVTGIELVGRSEDYAWDRPQDGGLERLTLFAGETQPHGVREIAAAMGNELDRLRPDAVFIPGWSDKGGLAALRWSVRNRVPAVVMSESNRYDEPRSLAREFVKRRIVGLCSAGLAGGHDATEYLANLGLPADRIALGYDVVDNDHFARGAAAARATAAAAMARLGLRRPYFLCCCRFVKKKNLARLLEAHAAYRASVASPWDLVIVGDGELRPALEEQIATLGLGGSVHLPGFVQYGQIAAYYGLASGFVLASTTEQWGLVVNEAMAAGLPVLVSDRCGCARDLVRNGENGTTFDPLDTAAITAAMRGLTADAATAAAMGEASRRIIAEWSPSRFAKGLEQALTVARSAPRRSSLAGRLLVNSMLR